MIESEEMKKKEEENINKSKRIIFFFLNSLKTSADIKQPNSSWKSAEPANDYLRKFRNYEI
jgi:hypothetical protein